MNALYHPRRGPAQPRTPTEGEIQHAAYFLWEEAGKPAGRDLELWLEAKERLRHRAAPTHASSPPRDAQPAHPLIR